MSRVTRILAVAGVSLGLVAGAVGVSAASTSGAQPVNPVVARGSSWT